MESTNSSDDEIYYGPMTLKEVKRAIMIGRRAKMCQPRSEVVNDEEGDINLFLTKSEPDLRKVEHESRDEANTLFGCHVNSIKANKSRTHSLLDDQEVPSFLVENSMFSSPDELSSTKYLKIISPETPVQPVTNAVSDASFEEMENFISCAGSLTEEQDDDGDLNNTLDQIEHILNMAKKLDSTSHKNKKSERDATCIRSKISENSSTTTKVCSSSQKKIEKNDPVASTPMLKKTTNTPILRKEYINFPARREPIQSPSKNYTFKTPAKLGNKCTATNSKFLTPSKNNLPAHNMLQSPIGYYLKYGSTALPFINVTARKGIPSNPDIESPSKMHNAKENILPKKAYQNATSSKIVEKNAVYIPKKLEGSKLLDKIITPSVIKHEKRQILAEKRQPSEITKANMTVEDSFANLSVMHADVSLCAGGVAGKTNTWTNKY